MIKLDYKIDETDLTADGDLSSSSIDSDTKLHYYAFYGDITFIVDGADFSAKWGWVPVLDFAVCLSGGS